MPVTMQDNMKTILFTTLLLFSVNGFAFNWTKITETSGETFYIDVNNMKKRNGLVYVWVLADQDEPSQFNQGNAYSFITKQKVDCEEETTTVLSATFHGRPMGNGRIVYEYNPNKVTYERPNTAGYTLMKFACRYAE